MQIAVIDGQGGGIGATIIEKIRTRIGHQVNILALGTNALATAAMLKAGANQGATGENAIRVNCGKVSVILGSLSIILADSLLGELTPLMAQSIIDSPATKILIQPNRHNIHIAGLIKQPLPHHIDESIKLLEQIMKEQINV